MANDQGTGSDDAGSKEPPKDDKGTGTGGTGGTDPNVKGTDTEAIRSLVREEIRSALADLKGEAGTPKQDGEHAPTTRRETIEALAKAEVEKAAERLQAQKEHDADHARLKETKEPEKTPKKLKRSTRLLWGSDE